MRPVLMSLLLLSLGVLPPAAPAATAATADDSGADLFRFQEDESPKAAIAAIGSAASGSADEGTRVLAERRIAIDFAALEGSPRLPLLDQRVYGLQRTDLERRGPSDFAWRGKVVDLQGGEVGTATLTVLGDLIAGLIVMNDALYEIEPTPAGDHRLIQVETATGTCGGQVLPDLPVRTPRQRQAARLAAEAAGAASIAGIAGIAGKGSGKIRTENAAATSRLDVLAVWTPAARNGLGGTRQVRLLIQNSVDVTNTSFINSRIDARVNLVHAREVNYAETGNPETDLFWVKNDKSIAALRKTVGADMVSMFVNQMTGACGIGFLMSNDAYTPEFAPWAYSTVKRACGALVLAHELGHNLSCNHDVQNASPEYALFPYSFGHIVEGSFRTVMAYGNNCTSCPWTENFSNPDVTRNGAPTGIAGQRDNARAINNTRDLVSNFQSVQACKPGPNNLCLLNKRFRVELFWENQYNNTQGIGSAVPRTDAAGFFTFGDPSNIELMVKMLDFGDAIKVFYGQLTNLKFSLIVTDTATGTAKVYSNTARECGAIDQSAFSSSRSFLVVGTAPAAATCKKDKNTLCLLNNRFQVKVAWRNPGNGTSGSGGAVPISGVTGAFYFTDAGNLELMTKVIDYGDRIDIFYGTLSDLEYTITVTDTKTGAVKTYQNPAGTFCGGQDGNAFPR